MRYGFAGVAVVALVLGFSAAPQAGQAPRTAPAGQRATAAAQTTQAAQRTPAAAAQKLPPLSYVCPMPQDADVVEDKPGVCPKCGMKLEAIRLDSKWWCPVHQALEVHDGPGKCRRDGRDLVQVTLAEFWSCGDAPDKKLLEPGSCGDGSARKISYELRAHGDHNPRHGGQFFMASDAWHHLEGTYPENGLFRVFFYDNFTKPMPAKGVSGSVVIRDKNDKEIGSAPLVAGKNGSTMEAKIPAANAALPLRATVKMKFTPTMAEQPFDFQFNEYSKDTAPAGTPIGPTSTPRPTTTGAATPPKPAAAPATASAAPKTPVAPAAAPPKPASATASATQESGATVIAPPPGRENDPFAGEIAPMPPALAAALNEEVLPKDVPGLVAELTNRAGQIDSLVRDGSLSEVWLPAMGTKTVALVLESHVSSLPAAKQAVVHQAVKRVVSAAWEIDGYGDLGNKTKIVEAYERLKGAVSDLKGAYEGAR